MGISLLKGRFFTDADVKGGHPVVIINQSMARQIWPAEEPLGKHIRVSWLNQDMQEVIGIVNDTKHESLEVQNSMETYMPYAQTPVPDLTLVVRTTGNPMSLVAAIKSQVLTIDKNQPIYNIQTLDTVMSESLSPRRFNMLILGIFAGIALVLAAVGIYGVIAYSVNQRSQEIGIRIALGAQRFDVLKLVVGQGMVLTTVGLVTGLAASVMLTRLISSLLFGVTATDFSTFAIISLVLTSVAFVACYVPGRRATKVDPMIALRYE
jgi:putative ABC transport system permease protein